jgi:hypothetical protein
MDEPQVVVATSPLSIRGMAHLATALPSVEKLVAKLLIDLI